MKQKNGDPPSETYPPIRLDVSPQTEQREEKCRRLSRGRKTISLSSTRQCVHGTQLQHSALRHLLA